MGFKLYKYMFLCQNLDLFNVSIVHVSFRMSALLLPLISPLLGNFLAQPYFLSGVCLMCLQVIWETWGISEECREDKDLFLFR